MITTRASSRTTTKAPATTRPIRATWIVTSIGVRDHRAYLEAVGGSARLDGLKASPDYGYSPT